MNMEVAGWLGVVPGVPNGEGLAGPVAGVPKMDVPAAGVPNKEGLAWPNVGPAEAGVAPNNGVGAAPNWLPNGDAAGKHTCLEFGIDRLQRDTYIRTGECPPCEVVAAAFALVAPKLNADPCRGKHNTDSEVPPARCRRTGGIPFRR